MRVTKAAWATSEVASCLNLRLATLEYSTQIGGCGLKLPTLAAGQLL